MSDLKTNYKNSILDTSTNTKQKFKMIQNDDGTVSFEDVTDYSQAGDDFGAADINATNAAVNSNVNAISELNTHLTNKLDYPDTITYNIMLGQLSTFGIYAFSTATDRLHVVIPIYAGYSNAIITCNKGTTNAINLTSHTALTISITDIQDVYVNKSGVLHLKALFNTTGLTPNCGYSLTVSTITLTVTLSK